jgi:hypothetical protein
VIALLEAGAVCASILMSEIRARSDGLVARRGRRLAALVQDSRPVPTGSGRSGTMMGW